MTKRIAIVSVVAASAALAGIATAATSGQAAPAAKENIVQTAAATGQFDTLVALAKKAGLAGALSTKTLTVFAPTDAEGPAGGPAVSRGRREGAGGQGRHSDLREDARGKQGPLCRQERQGVRELIPRDRSRREGIERDHPRRQQGAAAAVELAAARSPSPSPGHNVLRGSVLELPRDDRR
jgi:hypothetical protein